MCFGLGGTLGEGDPLWGNAGEVVKPTSPCPAEGVIGY